MNVVSSKQSQRKTTKMSAIKETKGKQANYGMFTTQLKGDSMGKGTKAALGSKFKDVLLAPEKASGQTAKQRETVKGNITGMGLIIRTVKSASLLVKSESTVSEDCPYGRVDLVVEIPDNQF